MGVQEEASSKRKGSSASEQGKREGGRQKWPGWGCFVLEREGYGPELVIIPLARLGADRKQCMRV